MRAQVLQDSVFESGDFEFDIEEGRCLVAREGLIEFGQICKVSAAGPCDFNVVNFRVVTDQGAAIGRAAHVEFEAVATVSEGKIEGREGVFRDGAGCAGAAMAQQDRT
jgi:hypothetical protein